MSERSITIVNLNQPTQVDDEKYKTKVNNATRLTIFKESPNS